MFRIAVCFAALLVVTNNVKADVIYGPGPTPRPTSFTGITVSGVSYNVSVTYFNNAAANPIRVGDLPDAQIGNATFSLLSLLNTQGVESNFTFLMLQPNVDTLTLAPGQFQYSGFLQEVQDGIDDWGGAPATFAEPAANFDSVNHGFLRFTAVPEPSALSAVATVVLISTVRRRRRRFV
jgi:hypothetical protein